MSKLNSKLFESLKLTDKESKNTIGGAYTVTASDTSSSSGNYDVTFETSNKDGSPKAKDAVFTGTGDTDAPLPTTVQPDDKGLKQN